MTDEQGEIPIPRILQAIKSTSAHRINKYLGRKGRVWQGESFDRAVRSVENLRGKIELWLATQFALDWSAILLTTAGSGLGSAGEDARCPTIFQKSSA
jgi:hypothetical protein